MTNVNWLDSSKYMENNQLGLDELFTEQAQIIEFFREATQHCNQVWFHDSRDDGEPTEYSRVLDDHPEEKWHIVFKWSTFGQNHKIHAKKQQDDKILYVVREAYPGATELPPVYLLVKEG